MLPDHPTLSRHESNSESINFFPSRTVIQDGSVFTRDLVLSHHTTPATTTAMAINSTSPLTEFHSSYLSTTHPWYYNPNPQLWSVMSDHWVSLLAPVAAFWLFTSFFEILDRGDWEWLQKYKLHKDPEAISRNRVTKKQVIAADIVQEVMQVALGYFWMDTTTKAGGPISMHIPHMEALAPIILRSLEALFGRRLAAFLWLHKAQELVYYVYWWAIPFAQLIFGW